MFDAMSRVDRSAMGFTPIARDADIRLEWGRGGPYDTMLHVYGKTSRTVAFKRAADGYEWIGEQETFTPISRANLRISNQHHRYQLSGRRA